MLINFLIEHFSYKILFVWSIFEGEIGLALAGFMVREGKFDFTTVLTIAIFGALIGAGIVSFVLGTIFGVEDIGFYILRFFLIIIGMLFCYLGANRAVTYRRPNRVIPGLILFGIGMILIFIGLLMFFRFELFSLA